MNTFWCSMLPSIVGIGAALVGGLIGWYLRRPRIQELESILDERHAEYMHIKNANEMLNMKHDNLQNTHTLLTLSHNSLEEREKLYQNAFSELENSNGTLSSEFSIFKINVENHIAELQALNEQLSLEYFNYKTQAENHFSELQASHESTSTELSNFKTNSENQNLELRALSSQEESLAADFEARGRRIAILESLVVQWENKLEDLIPDYEARGNQVLSLQSRIEDWENKQSNLNKEHEKHTNRIAELQELNDEWENALIALSMERNTLSRRTIELQELNDAWEAAFLNINTQLENKESSIAEMQKVHEHWESTYNQLDNEQSIYRTQIKTLESALTSIKSDYETLLSASDTTAESTDKELTFLQDEKANLEINRIKLENELDILRGHQNELSQRYNTLVDIDKAGKMRTDHIEANNQLLLQQIEKLNAERENEKRELQFAYENTLHTAHNKIAELENMYDEMVISYQTFHDEYGKLLESQRGYERRIISLETELQSVKNSKNGVEAITPIVAMPVGQDDLKMVEGIGPKIETLLNNAGIFTFAQLAQTELDRLNEILDAAGSRFRIHNPTTWASQAQLAANNEWEKLKELQDYLIGGRDKAASS